MRELWQVHFHWPLKLTLVESVAYACLAPGSRLMLVVGSDAMGLGATLRVCALPPSRELTVYGQRARSSST